jgi:hypothetical protein
MPLSEDYAVTPRYNEPRYDEMFDITKLTFCPYEKPILNTWEPSILRSFDITKFSRLRVSDPVPSENRTWKECVIFVIQSFCEMGGYYAYTTFIKYKSLAGSDAVVVILKIFVK